MFGLFQLGGGKNRTVSTKSLAGAFLLSRHGSRRITHYTYLVYYFGPYDFFFPYSILVILKSERLLVILV